MSVPSHENLSQPYMKRASYKEVNDKLVESKITGKVILPKVYDYFVEQEHSQSSAYDSSLETWISSDEMEDDGQDPNNIEDVHALLDFKLRHIIENDQDDYDPNEIEELAELVEAVAHLHDTRDIILKTYGVDSDPRTVFTTDTFNQFIRVSGQYNKDKMNRVIHLFQEGSLPTIIEFTKHYQEQLAEKIESNDWENKFASWRDEYAGYLNSSKAELYSDKKSLERSKEIVTSIPIVIQDPISSLVELFKNNEEFETMGHFDPNARDIHIDPFTIQSGVTHELGETELSDADIHKSIDLRVRIVFTHELIHSFTNTAYFTKISQDMDSYWGDGGLVTDIVARKQWPVFWTEGMTEKIAYIHVGQMLDDNTKTYEQRGADPEIIQRETSGLPRTEALLTKEAGQLREVSASTYLDHRALIDAIFSKLDWKKAGLTPEDAAILAARAFTEVPEDSTDSSSSNRLWFINAVNEAAHPGFLMKIQHLANLYGSDAVTAILMDKEYDPHDPAKLPYIVHQS